MSKISHSITQETRTHYSNNSAFKSGVRSRSGSLLHADATDRIPALHKGFNATKSDYEDHDRHTFNDIAPKHRRSASTAYQQHNQNPFSMRRASGDLRLPLPQTFTDIPIPIDAPPRSRWRTFYDNNRGLAYVLVAQIFGCLMNVTTRFLEIEGNRGEGMHPFQVGSMNAVKHALELTMADLTCQNGHNDHFKHPIHVLERHTLLPLRHARSTMAAHTPRHRRLLWRLWHVL